MKLKKLLSRIIIATGIMFTGTLTYQTIEHTHVSHAASYNYYSKHQCTWWAYKRRVQLGKPVSNRWEMLGTGTTTHAVQVTQRDTNQKNTLLCNLLQVIMGTWQL